MQDPPPTEATTVARSRVARGAWMSAGFVAVGIGSVGIVVPGLPTTGFFVLAAWCFSRSSPRFEQWVLDLPHIGQLVRDHRAGLGMPARAKVMAISTMWLAISISCWILRDRPAIAALVVALGLIGTAYLLWRVPTKAAGVHAPAVRTTGERDD
ncbi:MAG: YbaN family protein [Acidimicrobiales bacterium]